MFRIQNSFPPGHIFVSEGNGVLTIKTALFTLTPLPPSPRAPLTLLPSLLTTHRRFERKITEMMCVLCNFTPLVFSVVKQ